MLPFSLGVSLLLHPLKNESRQLMLLLLFGTCILFFLNYLYFMEDYDFYVPLHSFHAAIDFAIFPSIFLYMKSIIHPGIDLRKKLYHFLPMVLMLVVASYIFYVYAGKKDLIFFLEHNRLGHSFAGYQFHVLKVARMIHLLLVLIQGIVYSIAFNLTPRHYNEKLKNEFSNIDHFSIDWINRYNLSFLSILVVGLTLYALLPITGIRELLIIFIFFTFSAFICIIGLVSLKQKEADTDWEAIEPQAVNETVSERMANKILLQSLLHLMETKKPYLEPDLSLTQLSKELGTNRTSLSNIINQYMQTNFCTFVNKYRIEEVHHYLKDKPNASNQELAQMAGFGSVSSMKRAMEKD